MELTKSKIGSGELEGTCFKAEETDEGNILLSVWHDSEPEKVETTKINKDGTRLCMAIGWVFSHYAWEVMFGGWEAAECDMVVDCLKLALDCDL